MSTDRLWPDGYDRLILDNVDSTLNEAARRAPTTAAPTWILAKSQTAARGRRGRAWDSPPGNFAATLILRPEGGPAQAALRSFLAALALAETVQAVSGRAEGVTLKWPNDVLLNGGKLAGILLESAGQGGAVAHLLIGIGVNLVAAPPPEAVEARALRPVSLVSETGALVSPDDFLTHLAVAYARLEATFQARGFDPIRAAWLAQAHGIGTEVTARTGTAETRGRFVTVDKDGCLVLEGADGRTRIPAGDVFF